MNPEQTVNPIIQFAPFILIFVIFYFLVIRPEKNKQKEHKQKLTSLKKNDHVITNGGVHGTVINVKETTFILRIDDNVKIEIEKEAVSTVKEKAVKEKSG